MVFRGVDPTTPMDVTLTTATGGNSVLANPPSITPVTAGAWIACFGFGAHTDGTDTYTSAGDLTLFTSSGGNTTNDGTAGAGYKDDWVSGSFDPGAWTFSGTDSTSFSWCAVTVALRPA